MSFLLFIATAISPDPSAGDAVKARPCRAAAHAGSQIAYAPYGGAVFGSDGLACATVKAGPAGKALGRSRAPETRATPVLRGLGQKP